MPLHQLAGEGIADPGPQGQGMIPFARIHGLKRLAQKRKVAGFDGEGADDRMGGGRIIGGFRRGGGRDTDAGADAVLNLEKLDSD